MEKLIETDVKCEKGFVYFCKKDEKGNICVYRAKAGRPKKTDTGD